MTVKSVFLPLFLIASISVEAKLSDFRCLVDLKRIEKTPVLMKGETNQYFNFWMEALDIQVANQDMSPQEIAKLLKPSFGREDLEKMKKVIEEKVASVEKDFPAFDDFFLKQKEGHFLHPGDLTISEYHGFYRRRAGLFLKRIETILKADAFTYFDLLSSANMYSKIADAKESMGPYIGEMAKLDAEKRKVQIETSLKELVENAEKDHFHSFPIMLVVPTFKSLGFKSLNTMHGMPIYFAGMVDNPLWVDGRHHGIGEFYSHDYSHIPGAFDIFTAKHHRTKYGYVSNVGVFRKSREYQLRAMIDNSLKLNQLYGNFSKLVSNEAKFSKFERKLAEAVFFYYGHETPRLELLRIRTDIDLKEFFAKLEKDVRRQDFEPRMIERFNDTNDLGQGFKEEERPITRETISKLIRKIFS